ncbi:tryptophan--tRNA ligase [Aestuariispira ectoiniformans]|uniref:tryptophan--tRNA ligase n=1 Tax=Aestuariispira ectoiniformans TaxID=2775080 RepID=UPI00223A8285|nr:tryptophan--tRNA ligase [Aestuariispira ectoiniformans]
MSGSNPTNRIFSGVQPTGGLHLGNYLGAIRNWVRLQKDYECIFCVVDMHAITVWQDPVALRKATHEVAAAYIACGIDPEENILFHQSANPNHAELAWIFNCVARMGWLNRMTQFKDKAGKNRENASTGLFVYPNLMAADILAYKATHVPVGEDQKQHLELTRDIATKFNNDFGAEDFFPLPEPVIQKEAARIMSLRDGAKKMSKSDPSEYSRLIMTDGPDEIAQKLRKAKTDPEPLPSEMDGLEDRPEARNLVSIYAALQDIDDATALSRVAGKQFKDFKEELTDVAVTKLGPIGDEMKRLMAAPDHIEAILHKGGERAREISEPILRDVYDIVGFVGR